MQARALAWLAGAVGLGVVLYRRLRGRPPETELASDPAEELRQKLDEARTSVEPEPPMPALPGVDERRRQVHERGRAAIDDMRDRGAPEPPTA